MSDLVHLMLTMPEWREQEGRLNSIEELIVASARVSYLGQNKGYERDLRLLQYLFEHEHTTPFEVPTFLFRIEAPMVVFNHFVRHRTATFNVQSGRYTQYEDTFYVPPAEGWRMQSAVNHQGSDSSHLTPLEGEEFTNRFKQLIETSYTLYTDMLQARVAREMARLVLPSSALYIEFQMKIDLHNLLHFFKLRLNADAQFETRFFARQMAQLVEPLVPNVMRMFYTKYPHLDPNKPREDEQLANSGEAAASDSGG
jgi:thymidylate synthase (FAD)